MVALFGMLAVYWIAGHLTGAKNLKVTEDRLLTIIVLVVWMALGVTFMAIFGML